MNVFRLAWRNVWRNRRRSVVTIAAMTFALWVMVLYSGLITGYLNGMERDVLDLEVGDIQIFAPDFRDNPSIYSRIEDPDRLLARLDELGFRSSARLLGGGLAAAGTSSAGVAFRGVEVARDATVTLAQERVAEGTWLDPADPAGVVLGRRLARTLGVKPGAELVVLSQAADGSMANDLFTVRGVLMGISAATDRATVYMNAESFRELMVVPQGAHQIIVRRPADMELDVAAQRVLAVAPDLDVQTWRQLMPTISTMLDSARSVIYVLFFIIYIAVGILILNAMLMAVFERIREFGVFKALGVSPTRVLALILVEGTIQTVIAIVTGLALATPGIWYLSNHGVNVGRIGGMSVAGLAMHPVWYGEYTASSISGPVLTLVIIVFAAIVYPGLKAALIRPVEAMRHR